MVRECDRRAVRRARQHVENTQSQVTTAKWRPGRLKRHTARSARAALSRLLMTAPTSTHRPLIDGRFSPLVCGRARAGVSVCLCVCVCLCLRVRACQGWRRRSIIFPRENAPSVSAPVAIRTRPASQLSAPTLASGGSGEGGGWGGNKAVH